MNRALQLSIAAFFTVVSISILSTTWTFIPSVLYEPIDSFLLDQATSYLYWAAGVSGVIVTLIGVPVYLVLAYKNRASQFNLALVGFFIPVSIMLAITFLTANDGIGSYSSGQNYWGTYRKMVVDNERTMWGWLSLTEQFITFGIYGLFGATIFGKIALKLNGQHEKA